MKVKERKLHMGVKTIIFTQEQLDKMVELHNQKYLHKDIAKLFNTSRSTIDRTLKHLGVESRHPWLSEERKAKAISVYQECGTLRQTAKIVKMSDETIRTILVEKGIHVNDKSEVRRTCSIDEHYFDKIDSHRKAYYLGLLSADGSISAKGNRIQLSLQEQDADVIYSMAKDMKSTYKISTIKYSEKKASYKDQKSLNITNTVLHDALISLGITPNKSVKFEFPKSIPTCYYSSYILGYMDGDGSIIKSECRCILIGTVDFVEKVAAIIKKALGIHCSISYCHKKDSPTRQLRIAGKRQVKLFLDWIYSDCDIYIKRKYEIYCKKYCV